MQNKKVEWFEKLWINFALFIIAISSAGLILYVIVEIAKTGVQISP
jgi:hypothetical protein